MIKKNKYAIISCVKDEESVFEETILSVISQTHRPVNWLIIDDNSNDKTLEIIRKYSLEYSWINYMVNDEIKLKEKGPRISSIINFYFDKIDFSEINFFSKLDGDIKLPCKFYEQIITEFNKDNKLGIASGSLIYNGIKEKNFFPDLTRGATKIYRVKCFQEIGKLQQTTGWDTLDNIIAQKMGWKTKSFDIWFEHLKEEGKSQGYFNKFYNVGKYCGKIPYDPFYFTLKIIYRIFEWPIFLSSIITLFGYIHTRFITKERPFPEEVTKYYRNKQRNKLLMSIKKIFKL